MKFNILFTALLSTCVMSAAAADNSVVRIGVSNDRSGIYADLGGLGSEVAARMAVEDFGGEVLGKKIEVIGGDTQNKVDIAGQLVRSWFDTKNLVAVVDGGASSTGLAAAAIAREKNKAALISGGFAADFAGAQCAETTTQWRPTPMRWPKLWFAAMYRQVQNHGISLPPTIFLVKRWRKTPASLSTRKAARLWAVFDIH